ncbi:hypothetical protein R75461_08052 [Paraburkholderia nemoris]|nr:hypothetical protein [Paraburkholderia aspalathi]MBK3786996.1 hypothetical protein [Paraburkholderia aspalathi]CAE6862368.1 hypothetical protein R75461_08052 [Paraburkholderia nemoris]
MNHMLPPAVPAEHESEPDAHRTNKRVGHPYMQSRRRNRLNLRTVTEPHRGETPARAASPQHEAHTTPPPVLVTCRRRQSVPDLPHPVDNA